MADGIKHEGSVPAATPAAPSSMRFARSPNLAFLSFSIALMSLAAALFQGYINARNLAVVQRDLARREHVRGCKEAAELYFEAKLRIARYASRQRQGVADDGFEAALATGRLAAVSTYLANFGDGAARETYTALSAAMQALLDSAAGGTRNEAALADAERLFGKLNADCVAVSKID